MKGIFRPKVSDTQPAVQPVTNPYTQVTTPEKVQFFRWLRSPEGGSRTPEEALEKTVDAFKEP